MNVEDPRWTLKQPCPICGQGQSLALVTCPGCSALAAVCDEEGSVFFELAGSGLVGGGREDMPCAACGKHRVQEFVPASDVAIRAAGIAHTDYG